jgi:acetyl-CoA C-acetyltransferase
MTAENVVEQFHISMEDQDEFAFTSQMRAKRALETGRFKEEIMPFVFPGKRGKPDRIIDTDEHPRPETTLEELAKLPPAFKEGGTVTAGNSSGLNDGAFTTLIVSRELADSLNIQKKVEDSRVCSRRCRSEDYGDRPYSRSQEACGADGLQA